MYVAESNQFFDIHLPNGDIRQLVEDCLLEFTKENRINIPMVITGKVPKHPDYLKGFYFPTVNFAFCAENPDEQVVGIIILNHNSLVTVKITIGHANMFDLGIKAKEKIKEYFSKYI